MAKRKIVGGLFAAAKDHKKSAIRVLNTEADETVARLISVLKGTGYELPEAMLKEIEAISLEGADPQWQITEMKKILDRWAPQH